MHLVPGTNLVFIHIPKTAGQSLKAAFRIKSQSTGSHNVNSDTDRKFLGPNYVRFCVTRHPFDRFVSTFKYNVAEGMRRPQKKGSLAALMQANGLDSDVNSFANWLYETRYDLNKFAHLRPQSFYLEMGLPQIVLRHEMISTDCEIVRRLAPESWHGLPTKNVSAKKQGIGDLVTELSQKSELQLASLYADDFQRLGYHATSTKDKQRVL